MPPRLITLLPLFGAVLLLLVPREEEGLHRGLGLLTALVTFAALAVRAARLRRRPGWLPAVVDQRWVAPLGIHFHLGVDGISLWLVLLTTFLMPIRCSRRRRSASARGCASSSSPC